MAECLTRNEPTKSASEFRSINQWQQEIKEYLDPPNPFNITVILFISGYLHAGISIWEWYQQVWPLPVLVGISFLALHMEGTVIHDACHKAAHPNKWINQAMGHGAAILLGFSFPVFTRVHLQHHSHVNDPKNDPDHF